MRIKYRIKYRVFCVWLLSLRVFPGGSVGKESACNEGDPGSVPGSERSPREGNSNPLQHSCLENSMDRGAGGLQSMGLQRVKHSSATKHAHDCISLSKFLKITPIKV